MKSNHAPRTTKLARGIFEIDCFYLDRRAYTASYLVEKNGEIAIIETNTNRAVPIILDAVKQLGYGEDQIKYVVITHVHLDHAGGAGELISRLPGTRLVAHSRGARHMVQPDKLVASVKQVYGEKKFHQLYGDIKPVPANRVIGVGDRDRVALGGEVLLCLETPGHAKHHMVVFDSGSATVFSGDAFGIGYPRFDFNGFRLVFPSTAPVQFDPEQAKASYGKIVNTGARRILLTHFGEIAEIQAAREQLDQWIDVMVNLAGERFEEGKRDESLSTALTDDLWAYTEELIRDHRGRGLNDDEKDFLSLDITLNALGLATYIQRAKG